MKIDPTEYKCPHCGNWLDEDYCEICDKNITEHKQVKERKGDSNGYERIHRGRVHRLRPED